ncbi:hypothetical protein ACA910_010739 [Epithemia clementina (nom. ined.)]
MDESANVSVKMTYRIRGEEVNNVQLDSSTAISARMGLSRDVASFKPEAGSYDYGGTHDQGTLSEPREGGAMAQLIGCVIAAKHNNNEFMTKVMEENSK